MKASCVLSIEILYFSNKFFLQELINTRQREVDVRVAMPLEGNCGILTLTTPSGR